MLVRSASPEARARTRATASPTFRSTNRHGTRASPTSSRGRAGPRIRRPRHGSSCAPHASQSASLPATSRRCSRRRTRRTRPTSRPQRAFEQILVDEDRASGDRGGAAPRARRALRPRAGWGRLPLRRPLGDAAPEPRDRRRALRGGARERPGQRGSVHLPAGPLGRQAGRLGARRHARGEDRRQQRAARRSWWRRRASCSGGRSAT